VVGIIRREAQSSGKYVRVCDIARVDGPDKLVREVSMTILGPAPMRGESQEFSRWDIESRLYEMGVDANVTFSGNDVVRVFGDGAAVRSAASSNTRQEQELLPVPARSGLAGVAGDPARAAGSPEQNVRPQSGTVEPRTRAETSLRRDLLAPEARTRVGQVVSAYISDQYRAGKRPDIEVESKVLATDGDIPYSAFEIKVDEAIEAHIPGNALLRLTVKDTSSSAARKVTVSADAQVYGLSLVAARPVAKGDLLEKRDVAVTRVKMESGRMYLPPSPAKAAGLEAQKAFKPGEVIHPKDAIVGMAVKRGNMVVVKNEGKGWEILSKGKAQDGGGIDDLITVEDSSTKARFTARVTGPGTVAVVLKKDPNK
jgi:flagella basal body P-ring formation protein FlgA